LGKRVKIEHEEKRMSEQGHFWRRGGGTQRTDNVKRGGKKKEPKNLQARRPKTKEKKGERKTKGVPPEDDVQREWGKHRVGKKRT